jgi:hypothetical protein
LEIEEAALLPIAPTLRSGKLDRPVKYRFFRRSNFLAIRERNADLEEARRMRFRIGINQGDVVFDDTRVYGEGVIFPPRPCGSRLHGAQG